MIESTTFLDTPVVSLAPASSRYDVRALRAEFPILSRTVHGKPLVYLDNAATTQKPQEVISAIVRYYSEYNSNVHRGIHTLSQEATAAHEEVREQVRSFINAKSEKEILFVRGTTEAVNIIAHSFGKYAIEPGDEIIIAAMEHHSNIVPWQMMCEAQGAVLRVIPINDAGELLLDEYEALLTPRTKLVAVTHVSNTLGTINAIKEITALAHRNGARVFVDGAQAIPHLAVDVQDLDADFYCFSAHKIYGPTGIGVLYGKEELLNAMPPYQGGGAMISTVSFAKTTYNELPFKFEAGTPHIEGIIGLGAALRFVRRVGVQNIANHEHALTEYATQRLQTIEGLRIVGTAQYKAGVISFSMNGIHPHDIGTLLDNYGIAIRTGHHCTQPLMERFGVVALYTTREEIETLVMGLERVQEMMR
jgi:cysteine desulfurase / selenocysteine lyase